ncbi:hypothetical protein DTW94_09270 [Streptomyces cavourensis]|uniref:Uncharacterized protein n=1 Tax=Streptomyces cavourensis TaxID=67258 RepID=A0AAD0VE36_9ACTN|nr:hypothetical protein DTW94_09270 [Streptomyces cavourensis]
MGVSLETVERMDTAAPTLGEPGGPVRGPQTHARAQYQAQRQTQRQAQEHSRTRRTAPTAGHALGPVVKLPSSPEGRPCGVRCVRSQGAGMVL